MAANIKQALAKALASVGKVSLDIKVMEEEHFYSQLTKFTNSSLTESETQASIKKFEKDTLIFMNAKKAACQALECGYLTLSYTNEWCP